MQLGRLSFIAILSSVAGCNSVVGVDFAAARLADGGDAVATHTADGRATPRDASARDSKDGSGPSCATDGECLCNHAGCVAPTPTDNEQDDSETDVDCGGALLPDGQPNPASDGAPACANHLRCRLGTDCQSLVCGVDSDGSTAPAGIDGGTPGAPINCPSGESCTCQVPTPTDGVMNGGETDVDCGGTLLADGQPNPASDGAPVCPNRERCVVGNDCASGACAAGPLGAGVDGGVDAGPLGAADARVDAMPPDGGIPADGGGEAAIDAAPPPVRLNCPSGGSCTCQHVPGTQDGDETDVDCGGTESPPCDWFKHCLADTDCASNVCTTTNQQCVPGLSCQDVLHGGITCGTGEFGDPTAVQETCCKSLPVAGYVDPNYPGKTVYLDKYEITAGRLRAFIESLGATPNAQGYMAAHRPLVWDVEWENVLPTDVMNSMASFSVADPTVDLLYPGQDRYVLVDPYLVNEGFASISGSYTTDVGLYNSLGNAELFPEYSVQIAGDPPDYAATHNLNCSNAMGSYGFGTYWFDATTIATYEGGVGKYFSQDVLDEKSLNCTTTALFAAFCAWDGGQLATSGVSDFISGGTPLSTGFMQGIGFVGYPAPSGPGMTGRFAAGGAADCGVPANTINSTANTGICPGVYYYPDDGDNSYDASARVAPPGRVPTDAIALKPGDEPWMDLIGNLVEVVIATDGTTFVTRGYGIGWASATGHKNQESTARMKEGSIGARCMRVK